MSRRHEVLAGLDDRFLPLLADVMRGVGRATRRAVGPDGALGRRIAPWVRREPVISVALACVVAAAVLIAVTGGDDKGAVPAPSHVGPRLTVGRLLGPATGASVSTYESQASRRRDALDQLASSQRLDAVVDFDGYLTPLAVSQILAGTPGISIVRAFARVPPPQQASVHVLLTSAQVDLSAGLAAVLQSASQTALRYERELSRAITHPSAALEARIRAGAVQAAQARIDATGLSPSCGCVFALVVSGPVAQLQQLSRHSGVRILDPAPVDASLRSLMIVPLEPQVTGPVPALSFAGD